MTRTEQIASLLPFLRRYARALTGSQVAGDRYVKATLEALVTGRQGLDPHLKPQISLYQVFHRVWLQGGLPVKGNSVGVEQRLEAIRPADREPLLLTAVEGFSADDAAAILGLPKTEVNKAIARALAEIDKNLASRVLIIEDEAIIALDLEHLVVELGHTVCGIATTRDDAVRMAKERPPQLVLSDIKLADDSSGIDAVNDILQRFDIPVIFITAYPQRLLTGERPEPTYLITKPFSRDTVRATIGQALFFHTPKARD